MAEFTNSNHEPITVYYASPCPMQEIYLSGLKEGEILVSYEPFIIFDSNGLVNGMNSDFKQFYHLNTIREVVSIIRIDWTSTCAETQSMIQMEQFRENTIQTSPKIPQWVSFYSLELILMIILMVMVWRILIHEKD